MSGSVDTLSVADGVTHTTSNTSPKDFMPTESENSWKKD